MNHKSNPTFRPATRADIEAFYPDFKQTFHAWVVEIQDDVLGVGGIFYDKD